MKKKSIVLDRLAVEWASDLEAMVAELTTDSERPEAAEKLNSMVPELGEARGVHTAPFAERFAASGKAKCPIVNADFIESFSSPRFTRRFSASGKVAPAAKIRE